VVWGVHDDGSEGQDVLVKDTGNNSRLSNYWAERPSAPVSDLRLALDFESRRAAGRFEVLLTGRGEPYRFELDLAGGEARLVGPHPAIRDTRKISPLGPGRHRLEVVNVDGVFRAELDGKDVGLCEYSPDAGPAPKLSGAEFSASGGARVAVYRARLWRDIYYGCFGKEMTVCGPGPRSTYIEIPEKMCLFLGDNQLASSDGRAFGLKPEKSIVARAAFVLWPASRWHVVW
jgi:hypothetical protein